MTGEGTRGCGFQECKLTLTRHFCLHKPLYNISRAIGSGSGSSCVVHHRSVVYCKVDGLRDLVMTGKNEANYTNEMQVPSQQES